MKLIFAVATLVFAAHAGASPNSGDKPLGTVLGQTIMASQLGDTTGQKRERRMRSLFIKPLLNKWKDDHPDAVTPTVEEEAAALDCARKALASSKDPEVRIAPQQLVDFQLPFWKFEQSIYRAYGGGSLLFQQRGIEAYGAMRRFLEDAERNGDLTFDNEATRKGVFAYWNRGNNGYHVLNGPEYTAYFDTPPPCISDAERPPGLK